MTDQHTGGHRLRLVQLSEETMSALLADDLEAARASSGVQLTPYFIEHNWLWQIRLEQVRRDPASAPWIARAAVVEPDGVVVGHTGFHGPPDTHGMVEVAYSVDPLHRRKGYAHAMLRAALQRAADDPAVRTVRASISPDNVASIATIAPFGFVHVGEQWDEEDGLELLFERDASADVGTEPPA
jgi:[ribosomal protein S5]-alanine N-acetyltransferase